VLQSGFGPDLLELADHDRRDRKARPGALQMVAPDLQAIIVEDIKDSACAHLNEGLLYAHGMDEGGGSGASRGRRRP